METPVMPHSEEAEQAVLGSVIMDNTKLLTLAKYLKQEDFYNDRNGFIYGLMLEMVEASERIDVSTLVEKLEEKNKIDFIGGSVYLVHIYNQTLSASNAEFYAQRVHGHAIRRNLIKAGRSIQQMGFNVEMDEKLALSEANSKLLDISSVDTGEKSDIRSIMDDYDEQQNEYAESILAGKNIIGIPTGYRGFDYAIDGLRPHHLWTIAAFTSVGKSTLVLNIARNVINQKKRVVIFSFEMSKEDIVSRMIALELGWNPNEVMKGKASADAEKYEQLKSATYDMTLKKLSIYTNLETANDIVFAMRNECLKEKVDLFIVDYIQNVSSEKYMDEYALLTDATKRLQRAISSLDSTLIMVSQISIENQKSGNVLHINGKGSGAIRNASNLFAYLKNEGTEEEVLRYLESGDDMPMKCIINKNRQGRVLSFDLFRKQGTGLIFEPNIT